MTVTVRIDENRKLSGYLQTQRGLDYHPLRKKIRDITVNFLARRPFRQKINHGINCLVYHHVFDDEVKGFEKQLQWLKGQGDFISLDELFTLQRESKTIDGRYFCFTFDDGVLNCLNNALPLLREYGINATMFIVPDWIGIYRNGLHYFSWQDCRSWLEAGCSIGSHTMSHRNIAELDDESLKKELKFSKQIIEEKLQI